MGERGNIAVAVLAAGKSQRFGETDKLAVQFRGRRLGEHSAATLAEIPFKHRCVIARKPDHPCADAWGKAGFTTIVNADADNGMGTSVALAARHAEQVQADALLIALADMPLVPADHFASLVKLVCSRGEGYIASTLNGDIKMPPACFGKAWFRALCELAEDNGARDILNKGAAVQCESELLADIDDEVTLQRLA